MLRVQLGTHGKGLQVLQEVCFQNRLNLASPSFPMPTTNLDVPLVPSARQVCGRGSRASQVSHQSPELVSCASKRLEKRQLSKLGPEAKAGALSLGHRGIACPPWRVLGKGKGHSYWGSLRATSPIAPESQGAGQKREVGAWHMQAPCVGS